MDSLTRGLSAVRVWLDWLPDPLVSVLIILLGAGVALALHNWLRAVARRTLAGRYPTVFAFVTQMRGLTRLALLVLAMFIAVPVAPIDPVTQAVLGTGLLMAFIGLIGWSIAVGIHIAASLYLRRFNHETDDNLAARKHNTQIRVLLRAADVLLGVVTVGAMLMTVPAVRQYGISLLTSAGVAGIVAGLAARPVLSNLFAGVQIAITQPIRLEDAVIVEGEYGNVEEIASTYVVVRLWDLRRMIVPLTYFIEKPFQNWTRETSTLIGSVLIYLDYRAPVDAIRAEAERIVKASPKWDGRVFNVAVTDFKSDSMLVRISASAGNAGRTFDLRCEIREKLIGWLQREHGDALPRVRSEAQLPPRRGDGAHRDAAQAAAAAGGGDEITDG
jgi:small-conductance mechanosensitive channel